MKKGMFLMVFALIVVISLPVFVGTVVDDLRIVNTSALDPFEYRKYLGDDDLRRLAALSVSENPTLFPAIESFEATQDKSELEFHGSIDPEKEELEFISMPYYNEVGKYDVAVVKADGSIERYDKEVVIDYKERTIKTYDPIFVEEGDVVLLFDKEYVETAFEGVDVGMGNTPSNTSTPSTGRTGTTAGRQPGNVGVGPASHRP
ncbi:MAG: hypothetical protein JW885_16075 [Deltaproteobacteria bacterium]|nr:hypothetical protein [Candidatus Zymogenaceae bacterium]